MTFIERIRLFIRSRRGVTAIEYGILAAGVAIVIGALVSSDGPLATAISDLFKGIVDARWQIARFSLPQQWRSLFGQVGVI